MGFGGADLGEYDQTADAIQLRPFEVLCEVSQHVTAACCCL